MKKSLLTLILFTTMLSGFGQAFTNGGFENWTNYPITFPQYYPVNSNLNNMNWGFPSNATQVTDAQAGTYAVNLLTVANATDTSFAYIANGDPGNGTGGIPYTQKPLTATGFYKCNVPAGDTALILVIFKEGGSIVSFDLLKITGVQSTYTAFNLPLTIPGAANPDTVMFAAASSNAFIFQGIPGSMLQIDNISFTGVLSQPANLNGSFETWTNLNLYKPDNWLAAGDTSLRTTDNVGGTYALKLTTISYGGGGVGASILTNGDLPPMSGPVGGRPYTTSTDTLVGMYKFLPNGIDSATVWINLTNGGSPVGGAYVGLPPAASYTPFSIPFNCFTAPDTLLLVFASSFNSTLPSNVGSQFFLDDLYLKSQPLSTPQTANWNAFGMVKLFPNPATSFTTISFTNQNSTSTKITMHDALGKLVYQTTVEGNGVQSKQISLEGLQQGNYAVTLTQNNLHQTRLLIVK